MVKCGPAGMWACSLELVGLWFRVSVCVSDGVNGHAKLFRWRVRLRQHRRRSPAVIVCQRLAAS